MTLWCLWSLPFQGRSLYEILAAEGKLDGTLSGWRFTKRRSVGSMLDGAFRHRIVEAEHVVPRNIEDMFYACVEQTLEELLSDRIRFCRVHDHFSNPLG